MRKVSIKNMEGVSRKDLYSVDPKIIHVDETKNPRKDYGNESFQELKSQISQEGVQAPIYVFTNKDNRLELAHGFRRMRAVNELIEEGHPIASVPAIRVDNNEENILKMHYTLNGGLPMTDIEQSELLLHYQKLTEKSIKEIAIDFNMDYQKAHRLFNFAKTASSQIKEAVKSGELSITNGVEIARQASNIKEQNEVLTKARTNKEIGQVKIRPKDLKGVKQTTVSLGKILGRLEMMNTMPDVDTEFLTRTIDLLKALQENNPAIISQLVSIEQEVSA